MNVGIDDWSWYDEAEDDVDADKEINTTDIQWAFIHIQLIARFWI
jgi:hypothetical protein